MKNYFRAAVGRRRENFKLAAGGFYSFRLYRNVAGSVFVKTMRPSRITFRLPSLSLSVAFYPSRVGMYACTSNGFVPGPVPLSFKVRSHRLRQRNEIARHSTSKISAVRLILCRCRTRITSYRQCDERDREIPFILLSERAYLHHG